MMELRRLLPEFRILFFLEMLACDREQMKEGRKREGNGGGEGEKY
jgi:hypothetical protein